MGAVGAIKTLFHRMLGVEQRLLLARLRHGDLRPRRSPARDTVVVEGAEPVDAWSVREERLRRVLAVLATAGVRYHVLPDLPDEPARPRVGPRTVLVDTSSWGRALQSVRGLGPSWRVVGDGALVTAYEVSAPSDPLSRYDAGLGVRLERRDGVPGEDSAASAAPVRDVLEVRERVDVVYTWVDGADPGWRRRRDEAAGNATGAHRSATADSRFTSRDELRYSLRSLEAYAGWFGRVHLVTDGQVPRWLDTAHPRVQVVSHREIFRDPSVLPVFNSHAIESQLHRVPGLSERYLYLNDDVFLGRPVRPELFFDANGCNRFFLSTARIPPGLPSADDLPVDAAAKQNRELLVRRFGRAPSFKLQHVPHPQHRSVVEQIEAEYPQELAAVARSRFRSPADLSVASSLQHFWAYETGRAVPGRLDYLYVDLADPDLALQLYGLGRRRDRDVFCLNEVDLDPDVEPRVAALVARFLEDYFPRSGSFER